MKINFKSILVSLLFLFFFLCSFLCSPVQAKKKSYIVYLGTHTHGSQRSALEIDEITNSYHKLLSSCMGRNSSKEKAKEAIFYSYTRYFKGFAAVLEDDQVHQLSKHPDVISVFPNGEYKLYTTRSWEFMGFESNGLVLPNSLWNKANYGKDMIIATLDSGVWPEHASFDDQGMGPVPNRWKGGCDTNDGVRCNNKLIGAKFFNKGYEAFVGHPLDPSYQTARDTTGHGTHCLSTAAGRFVPDAEFLGSAWGTAKGGSPNARVASYKVCWPRCFDADILAAFEAAIYDGVDILSVSLGREPDDYFNHGFSVGAFHAVSNGVSVFAAGGNDGPQASTVSNVAPWTTTVAASTMDRTFPSAAILGNGLIFQGLSFNTDSSSPNQFYPLIYASDAKRPDDYDDQSRLCIHDYLDPDKVRGNIVYCEPGVIHDLSKSWAVANAGGVGVIIPTSHTTRTDPHFIPTAAICLKDGPSVLYYIRTTQSPVASISGITEVGRAVAPAMALFSSRGPNAITPAILKPDITAPGVDILAAYTRRSPASAHPNDTRYLPFNIISGTSMATPHVSGIAGLLKQLHPTWSPAAIQSAIMTTASPWNSRGDTILTEVYDEADPFSYGSGHIMPYAADDPGLVYDLSRYDYLMFLCSIGYGPDEVHVFDSSFDCPSTIPSVLDFNYPSITIPDLNGQVTLTRTLKNVGTPGKYTVSGKAPKGTSVTINPTSLTFNQLDEEQSFSVTITATDKTEGYVFGRMEWTDGVHVVRSPIVVQQS